MKSYWGVSQICAESRNSVKKTNLFMVTKSNPSDKCAAISSSSTENPSETIKKPLTTVIHWNDLEEWQRDNEFIHTGYRRASNSIHSCLKSLGFIHNETGNIYSHLIPSGFVLVLLICMVTELSRPFLLFYVGCISCLGISAFYHLLTSHSERISKIGNKFDYVGICVLIASSMIALVDIAYDDHPKERILFVALTSCLGLACTYASLSDKFRTPQYRPVRAKMFVCYGLSGILPILIGCIQFGYAEVSRRATCPWLYTEAFMYIFGAFSYAVRFPEKQAPGRFDIIGHSHQIFHLMVVLGAYSHYKALVGAKECATLRA